MNLTRQSGADRQIIQSYGNGGFRVSGAVFKGSVIITPTQTLTWHVASMAQLVLDDFQALIAQAGSTDVFLLGCGAGMLPLPRDIRAVLKEAGVSIDPMDTGAACRTFNVLTGERRAVTSALIAV